MESDKSLFDYGKARKVLEGFNDVIAVCSVNDDVNLLEIYHAVKSLCAVVEATLVTRFDGLTVDLEPRQSILDGLSVLEDLEDTE